MTNFTVTDQATPPMLRLLHRIAGACYGTLGHLKNNSSFERITMTPHQIELVQNSFAAIKPIADTASELFYNRLFTIDPKLRPLFKGDIKQQGQMLTSMLGVAVNGLNNLEALAPAVRQLGARHVGYGVRDEHYATVGAALLWTLGQGLGEAFTPPVREAWGSAYGLLANVMQEGARDAGNPLLEVYSATAQ
jgi:hemoglobin-like flavoprotein